MSIVVVNCGSTSLKAERLDPATGQRFASVTVERIGEGVPDHRAALEQALPELVPNSDDVVTAVGHRVVHGGEKFVAPTRLNEETVAAIEAIAHLAPLHVPANIQGIRAAMAVLPDVPHVAVFDTAAHATLPRRARTYALPAELSDKHGIRRYGFHGPSHSLVAHRAADWLQSDIRDLRLITCHLGGGCSVTAWEGGDSVETSMGMTPLEGLMMSTRSGDVDAGALLAIARAEGLDLDGIDRLLNKNSGFMGLTGARDLRDIEARAAEGDDAARLAIGVFAHRVRKYIGAYAAVLGGVDAVVFTGGIGENAVSMRRRICQRFAYLGAVLDFDKNQEAVVTSDEPVAELSASRSRCRLLAVQTDENLAIAADTARLLGDMDALPSLPPIPVKISARHVHLTHEHVEALFGEGHSLTPKRPLGQPGQFICEERVTVVGPKRSIERVGIIGPPRKASQVEVSRTDEFHLGVDAPVRLSGDHRGSAGIVLEGPNGRVTLTSGLICAWRHIHMKPEHAAAYGVKHGDMVEVELNTESRDLVLRDVMIRVRDSYELEMHIDTDEANAADLGRGAIGILNPTSGKATLTRRATRHDRVGRS